MAPSPGLIYPLSYYWVALPLLSDHDDSSASYIPGRSKPGTSDMSDLKDFIYTPLAEPERSLRLLTLLAAEDGNADSQLRGHICSYTREGTPDYTPISYTWGTQSPTSVLILKTPKQPEWARFYIRPNLEALLTQYRREPDKPAIWVDAICIDQQNDKEKNHQVQHIDKIYRDRDTFVWLGEQPDTSDAVMDLIDRQRQFTKQVVNEDGTSSWFHHTTEGSLKDLDYMQSRAALKEFFSRPWFTRRWIVQEYVLSRTQKF